MSPPHGFVAGQFRFDRSAYWLPRSARVVASTISCPPFWAIRFDLHDDVKVPDAPGYLCVVSSTLSPIPLPNASFTIGPKRAIDNDEHSLDAGAESAQLTVTPAICCETRALHAPLYLHTVPVLSIAEAQDIPMTVYYRLDDDSFLRFRTAVLANRGELIRAWIQRRQAVLAERLPHHSDALSDNARGDCDLFSGGNPNPTHVFGELNNHHVYSFDFFDSGPVPFLDYPSPIYDQIFIFFQLCKDYRWRGVEKTIEYVRAVRRDLRAPRNTLQPSGYEEYDAHAPARGLAQRSLKQDPTFQAHFASFASLAALGFTRCAEMSDSMSSIVVGSSEYTGSRNGRTGRRSRSPTSSRPGNDGIGHDNEAGSEGGHRSSRAVSAKGVDEARVLLWFLSFDYKLLPSRFPRVLLPSCPKIVVLDICGVVLDREGATHDALAPWVSLAHRGPQDLSQAVKLYIELEALAARSQLSRATSLATIVHTALSALANKLDMAPSETRSTFLADAMARIIAPRPYDDTVQALDRLSRHGYTVVGLSPFSPSTSDALRPVLHHGMHIFPASIPVHAHVPPAFFKKLWQWCQRLDSDSGVRTSTLAAADVLVVSGGTGRVLASAIAEAHPTVLIRRPGGVECSVDFVVGLDDANPHPSAVVDSLAAVGDILRI